MGFQEFGIVLRQCEPFLFEFKVPFHFF
jgi:hypothetical protein